MEKGGRVVEDRVIAIPLTITQEFVDDLMSCALDGGINYWVSGIYCDDKKGAEYMSEALSQGAEIKILVVPFESTSKCTMSKEHPNYAEYILTLDKLIKGYKKYVRWCMKKKRNFITSSDDPYFDAEFGDMIVQFALFGELVFG